MRETLEYMANTALYLLSCCRRVRHWALSEAPSSSPALIPEQEISDFGVVLGWGNFSTVYTAKWNGMPVAIKRLKAGADYEEEAQMMSRLEHRHVVKLHGIVFQNSCPALVLERLQGENLATYLEQHEFNELGQALTRHQIALGVAKGLVYLHDLWIIHRDIKAENIFLDQNLNPKIGDFGLSLQLPVGEREIPIEKNAGTNGWAPPNLYIPYQGQYISSQKDDIFSLGMLIHLMLLSRQRTVYSHLQDEMEVVRQIVRQEFPPIPATTSATKRALILQCWKFERDDRPTAREVVQTLRAGL